MRRTFAIVALAAPLIVSACSSFGAAEPSADGPDAAAPADAAAPSSDAGPGAADGAILDGPPSALDGGVDASPKAGGCVAFPAVDFCSDFDATGLTPWVTSGDPSNRLKTAPSGAGINRVLAIPVPTDTVPLTAFLHHDAPATSAFSFSVDATLPSSPLGDYVPWFTIDARPAKAAFSLELRIDADTTVSAYESGVKVASLGAMPTSGMVRFDGSVAFESDRLVITVRRDGAVLAAVNKPHRDVPIGLRLSVGLVDAEASGGGTIEVDNIVFDTP